MCKLIVGEENPVSKAVRHHISHPPLSIYLVIVNTTIQQCELRTQTGLITLQHLNSAVMPWYEMAYYAYC